MVTFHCLCLKFSTSPFLILDICVSVALTTKLMVDAITKAVFNLSAVVSLWLWYWSANQKAIQIPVLSLLRPSASININCIVFCTLDNCVC